MRTAIPSSIAIAILTLSLSVFAATSQDEEFAVKCADAKNFMYAGPTGRCTCSSEALAFKFGLSSSTKCLSPPGDPTLSVPVCARGTGGAAAICEFICTKDATRTATGCEKSTPAQNPNPTPSDDFVKDCATDFSFSFASPTEVCKCYRKPSLAKSGSQCGPPPSGHGKGGCKNVGAKASKCGIICDAPAYKLSDDGLDCVLAVKDVEMKEDEYSDAGGGQYMSAVPGQGCVCLDTPGPYWCKPATPDIGTPMCSDKTTAATGRVIECIIGDCPVGYIAKGAKCELDEGAFGTISSVTKCKTPSTIYALPATAGCSCVAPGAAVPAGGKKCAIPGDGYATCAYANKTPRVPASCGSNCNPGFVKPDGATDCEAE